MSYHHQAYPPPQGYGPQQVYVPQPQHGIPQQPPQQPMPQHQMPQQHMQQPMQQQQQMQQQQMQQQQMQQPPMQQQPQHAQQAQPPPEPMPPQPLYHTWCWWFFKGPPSKETIEAAKAQGKSEDALWRESNVQIQQPVRTVQDFWICAKLLPKPTELTVNKQGFILAREGCRPEWEDPELAEGGMWTFKVQQQSDADDLWRYLLMATIGQMFRSQRHGLDDNEIVALQHEVKTGGRVAGKDIFIKVWHRTDRLRDAVKERLKELLDGAPRSQFRQAVLWGQPTAAFSAAGGRGGASLTGNYDCFHKSNPTRPLASGGESAR
eukprot:TRINITY_DN19803_c0_g1_i2.p1 TRINITY_DN19803_c0_g1~~TRINITY_DN19803_c0_g1_i2.p1  ORF type:complete len:321 (+),score=101.65 TRINITY_DN19803_c0_g1_i2:216-1178(+)